ncbi:Fe-S cluster assembly protein SufD [Halobacteriovorax sp. HLS]|uniref:Fe-S cluster assembly protein SufD n=1 Tax=Halobacteriovorax sp. HLS TaxID=2234000 RepID=UPI000FD7832D|nr:Fe-S cluster assembly protein SufD [Halobacteriovorax sp. HLS]
MNINEITNNYISDLEAIAKTSSQKSSLELFKEIGLPHTKMEDWIYTKLTDVLPTNYKKVSKTTILKDVKVVGKYQIVTLNGKVSVADSFLPDEIKLNLIELDEEDANDDKKDIFARINGASCDEVISLEIPKNYICDDVITLVHLSDFEGEFSNPRIHVTAAELSECTLVEVFTGADELKYNVNAVSNFKVLAGAKLTHTKVQIDGKSAFHVNSVNADVHRDAHFNSFTFTTGAKKSRNNLTVRLQQENATCSVDGLYALNGDQHSDNFSLIAHIKPHTESSQLFKGVLNGSSRGVFTGKVLVCRDAQQVSSEQLNKNLLLSKKSHADTRPQLEVYADDVKCAHGATVGQMSDEEAFYLQSRGLSKERAQKLLIHAFCSEAIAKVNNEKVETYLSEILFESFEKEVFETLEQGQ